MTFNAFLIEVEGKTTKSELNFIRSFCTYAIILFIFSKLFLISFTDPFLASKQKTGFLLFDFVSLKITNKTILPTILF